MQWKISTVICRQVAVGGVVDPQLDWTLTGPIENETEESPSAATAAARPLDAWTGTETAIALETASRIEDAVAHLGAGAVRTTASGIAPASETPGETAVETVTLAVIAAATVETGRRDGTAGIAAQVGVARSGLVVMCYPLG